MARDELVGDRLAQLGGDRIVPADLVDVVGERRTVEQLTVEVAGDQAQGGEDGPGDDQDPHDDGRAHQHKSPRWRRVNRCSAVAELHVVALALARVPLARAGDLLVGVVEQLVPVGEPADHPPEGEQHREHLDREAHRLVDQPE